MQLGLKFFRKKVSKYIDPPDFNINSEVRKLIASDTRFKLKNFLFIYALIRSEEEHDFSMTIGYIYPTGEFGSSTGPGQVMEWKDNSADGRVATEWTELQGDEFRVRLKNSSNVTQKYDVVLYGVR